MLFKEKNVKSKSEDRTLLDLQIERLEEELSDLADIKEFFIAIFILVVLVFVAYSLDSFLKLQRNQLGSKFWFGLSVFDIFAFIFIGGYSLKKLNKFIQKLKDERDIATKEREAEKRVQKFLEENLIEDYHVFKNVYTGYGDIDAIVVGPTGIFVVEVKSNSGLITKNDKGYLAVIEGESPSKNYREQVIKEAFQVKKYLELNFPEEKFWVNPILVFPFGQPIKDLVLDSNLDNFKVPVMDEKNLLKYIYSNGQDKLSKDQITKIVKIIGNWNRD